MDTPDVEARKKLIREISEKVQSLVTKHDAPPKDLVLALALQVGTLLSRFESEQRGYLQVEQDVRIQKRLLFGDPVDTDNNPGLIHVVAEMRKQQLANAEVLGSIKRTLWKATAGILGAVGLAVLKAVWPWILKVLAQVKV